MNKRRTALPRFVGLRLPTLLLALALASGSLSAADEFFESPKYGVKTRLPEAWPVAAREKDELIFVCQIPQRNLPDRPGAMACEIAIAPESLEEYRTRIEGNARRGTRRGELVLNSVLPKTAQGLPERLESQWEFRLPSGETWREVSVLVIRGRHLYTFTLNVEAENLKAARPRFDEAIASAEYSTPDSGAAKIEGASTNRWIQSQYQFVVDLPEGWGALLAPNEVAILYANGPPKGIWADNMLVLASKPGKIDYAGLAATLPADLEAVEPTCKVRSSQVVKTKTGAEALETVVDVKRGPFSMTIHEWRFPGVRFNYELKFTVETQRYDSLKPLMVRCFESFAELPDEAEARKAVPAAP